MLDLNPETVCLFIAKAREFHAKEEVVIPEEPNSPSEDWALQVLADHLGDYTYDEMKNLFEDLEPDQQVSVLALMWLGRGDFEEDEWENALAEARDQWNTGVCDLLIATPLVSDYLEEGLGLLGYSCQE